MFVFIESSKFLSPLFLREICFWYVRWENEVIVYIVYKAIDKEKNSADYRYDNI